MNEQTLLATVDPLEALIMEEKGCKKNRMQRKRRPVLIVVCQH